MPLCYSVTVKRLHESLYIFWNDQSKLLDRFKYTIKHSNTTITALFYISRYVFCTENHYASYKKKNSKIITLKTKIHHKRLEVNPQITFQTVWNLKDGMVFGDRSPVLKINLFAAIIQSPLNYGTFVSWAVSANASAQKAENNPTHSYNLPSNNHKKLKLSKHWEIIFCWK